jgi:hypothetical protein
MKVKYLASFLFFAFLFFSILKSDVLADCEVASFDETTRNLTVCVGGFDTQLELLNTTATFICLNNSNMLTGGSCHGVTGPTTFNLANTPENQIAIDETNHYYTCFIAQGINRAIGSIAVSFADSDNPGITTCMTEAYTTKPDDWDPLVEGLPWSGSTPTPSSTSVCTGEGTVNTAIGCVDTSSPETLIAFIIRLATGIGGGIALLLILFGVFIVTTSAGNPDKLKSGTEMITSAIIGLVFIIISIFLVKLIGINILSIPGLV